MAPFILLLVLSLVSASGPVERGKELTSRRGATGTVTFSSSALAPPAGSVLHGLDRLRERLVAEYEVRVRRYAGAGDTSIHKALATIDRLLTKGQVQGAAALIEELEKDIRRAQSSSEIEPLMAKWNARYPSELPVDVLVNDLAQFLQVLDQLKQELEDELFAVALHERVRRSLQAAAREMEDMFPDDWGAQFVTTSFTVHVAEALRKFVDGVASFSVALSGPPKFFRIVCAVMDRFPLLEPQEWYLIVDGELGVGLNSILFPSQKLEIIPPDEFRRRSECTPGPSGAA